MGEIPSTFTVVMPRLGLTMTEARITAWLKPEGAWVEKGEGLFVLEHEKASLEIEAPASGRLHILTPVDQVVPILTPVAALVGAEAAGTRAAPSPLPDMLEQPTTRPAPPAGSLATTGESPGTAGPPRFSPPRNSPLRASPKARRLARQHGISLQGLVGTGPRGMVVAADVQNLLRAPRAMKVSPLAQRVAQEKGVEVAGVSGTGLRGQVTRRDVEQAAAQALRPGPSPELASLKGLRGIIANRLSASWIERPQVTLTTDADATELAVLRRKVQADWALKVSYEAILIGLAARALQEYPYMNAQLIPAGIQVMPETNIGLAVDTGRGLVVPVLRRAGSKSLYEINEEINGLVERATARRSLPDELTGGTFTITNLGMYEIDAFTPIINPPECAILGVGRIVSRPVGWSGQIVLREMMALSLSFDHRLVDGAPAARFLQRIKILIETCSEIGLDYGN